MKNINSILKIFFAGDFAPCRGYEKLVLEKGRAVFGDLQYRISKADLSFLNLETPACMNDMQIKPIKKCGPNIRAHPDCVSAIADAGFHVAGLANNHIMDFGDKGLKETIKTCFQAGIVTCGAGDNLQEAQKPLFIEKKGMTIAIIAVAEHEFSIAQEYKPGAAPLDPIDNLAQLEAAKKHADMVFITIHGGNEYFSYPRPGLRKICRFYVDKGADAVICHHAHVPGAYEFYQNRPIIYSLGNLIFDHPNNPEGWAQGYAVQLNYNPKSNNLKSLEIIPYTQSVKQGGIKIMKDLEKDAFTKMLNKYRDVLSNDSLYEKKWDDFCKSREKGILVRAFSNIKFKGLSRIAVLFPIDKLLLSESTKYEKNNIIECQSHHELLLKVIKSKCK